MDFSKAKDSLERRRERERSRYHSDTAYRLKKIMRAQQSYQNNREAVLLRMAAYKVQVKQIISEAKSQPCANCGQTFPEKAMELHHVDPSTKKFDVGQATTPNQARRELAKCVPLCAICHRLAH